MSLKCERCNTHIDKHPINRCLDAWIMSCQGYRIVEVYPGDARMILKKNGTFAVLNLQDGIPRDERYFVEIHEALIPAVDGLASIREIINSPCVTKVPEFVSTMSFENTHRLVDFIKRQTGDVNETFFQILKDELSKTAGHEVQDKDVLFALNPTAVAKAFIKTHDRHNINKVPGAEIKDFGWVRFA